MAVELRRYPEVRHEGRPRLGRHQARDSRSLEYTIERAGEVVAAIKPAEWISPLPILDQGQIGSCVGNGSTASLAERSGADWAKLVLAGNTLNGDAANDEKFAVEVYHEATVLDGDAYPPDDNGTSGLSACKVLKTAGLISGYQWATTLQGFASQLQVGSVIVGFPWFNAFFEPDADGFIDAKGWADSQVAGGHEFIVEALETWNDKNPGASVVRARNSWSLSWGVKGCFRFRLATYQLLRDHVDIKQFVV